MFSPQVSQVSSQSQDVGQTHAIPQEAQSAFRWTGRGEGVGREGGTGVTHLTHLTLSFLPTVSSLLCGNGFRLRLYVDKYLITASRFPKSTYLVER